MSQILDSFVAMDYTVLVLKEPIPKWWKKGVRINNTEYETDIVYDIPNAICVKGKGNFKDKFVEFI